MKKTIAAAAALLILAGAAFADSIYVWTDEKGVKNFSDQPPEGVKNYQKIENDGTETPSDENLRPKYQEMLERVKQESSESDQRKAQEAAARQAEEERAAQAQKDAKKQAERDRLQKQIDELKNRAVSPTFSKGMRDNLIQELQKQIDALDQPGK
ncbi:MAG: DUF4124 domain-containing protein [Desulfobacteraceae bacterium]|nr:DUF4124 domain-containing protein [Desulfobacteraceae bacterium]